MTTYTCKYCNCTAKPKKVTKEPLTRKTKQEVIVTEITCAICDKTYSTEKITKQATLEYSDFCNHGNWYNTCGLPYCTNDELVPIRCFSS